MARTTFSQTERLGAPHCIGALVGRLDAIMSGGSTGLITLPCGISRSRMDLGRAISNGTKGSHTARSNGAVPYRLRTRASGGETS